GVCPQRRAVRQARLHARHILGHAGGLHRIDRRHPAGAGTVYALCGGGRRHLYDRGREIHLGQWLLLVARRLGIRAADRLLRAFLPERRRRRWVARPRDRTRTLIEPFSVDRALSKKGRRRRAHRQVHNPLLASRAPSASASSFAHVIDGWTRRWNGPWAKPQSGPASPFSRPRSRGKRT